MTDRRPIVVGGFAIDGPAAEQVAGLLQASLRWRWARNQAELDAANEALLDAVERLLDTRRPQARATVGFAGPRARGRVDGPGSGRPASAGSPGGPYEGLRGEIADALKEPRA